MIWKDQSKTYKMMIPKKYTKLLKKINKNLKIKYYHLIKNQIQNQIKMT